MKCELLANSDRRDLKDMLIGRNFNGYEFQSTYKLVPDSGRKTALADAISQSLSPFPGSFLWIDEFGIWSSCENVELFHGYRSSLGENRSLYSADLHIFESEEIGVSKCLLCMVLYFIWGCYLSNGDKSVILRISHDEYIMVYCSNLESLVQWKLLLEEQFGLALMV